MPTATGPGSCSAAQVSGLYRVDGGGLSAQAAPHRRDLSPRCRCRHPATVQAVHHPQSDRDSDRDLRADPVTAADRSRAPSPGAGEEPHPWWESSSSAGDVREVHHVALLDRLRGRRGEPLPGVGDRSKVMIAHDLQGCWATSTPTAGSAQPTSRPLGKGVLKVMSKMGVSTVSSYCGRADLRGHRPRPRNSSIEYFTGTTSKLGGVGLDVRWRPKRSPCGTPGGLPRPSADLAAAHRQPRAVGGEYQWRREGEHAPVRPRDRVPVAALHA